MIILSGAMPVTWLAARAEIGSSRPFCVLRHPDLPM